ncbi:nucleotide-binding universal stress UspA family protein [Mucilaginibacter sp. UYP25]|uniref:universal stress protein n=1 Tax=unclassified Mucilaginibacter TaxID=2617802 RepID=UPI0033976E37
MKTTINNILIPIDLSDTGLNALNTAVKMASRQRANLHLLYVQDIMNYYPRQGQLSTIEPMMEEIFEKDKYLIERTAAAIVKDYQVNCHCHTVTGLLSTAVEEMAKEINADLIITGIPSGLKDQSYLFDSAAYQIIKSAPCHVLTVPAGRKVNNFKHIVYPVISDGQPMASLPLTSAVIEKNDADVSIVSVIQKDNADLLSSITSFAERIRHKTQKISRSARTRPLYTSNVVKALSRICREEEADLIVIELNKTRTLKEFFYGSFTQKMIRNPDAAVLCVKGDFKSKATTLKIAYQRKANLTV